MRRAIVAKESNWRRTLQSALAEELAIAVPNEFDRVFRAYHGLVFRTAYRITGNAADAEDVSQTVFLRLFRRGEQGNVLENEESYLRRAAINAALDVIRARQADRTVELVDMPAEPAQARFSRVAAGVGTGAGSTEAAAGGNFCIALSGRIQQSADCADAGYFTGAGGGYRPPHTATASQGAWRIPRRQVMKNEKFDRMLAEIRNEQVDDQVVAQAGARVWKSIAGNAPAADLNAHTLRRCEDFQALIPGYLAKQLAPGRALLFEDHVHACVACRHALERARDGELQTVWRVESKRPRSMAPRSMAWNWAMGAAAVFAVAVAVVAFATGCFPDSMWFARRCRQWTARSIPGQARKCG